MPLERVPTRNKAGGVREVRRGSRTYLVAPLSMLVPGVLNGSRGRLYYPREEVAKSYTDWDGMPIVLRHPRGEDGSPVQARDPDVYERYGLGHVYRSRVTDNTGTLAAEGWFDAARVKRLAPGVYQAIKAGKPLELSTGLHTRNVPGKGTDPRTGRAYDYTATHYRPDHLAVLPDETGACSVADGCGVNVVANAAAKRKGLAGKPCGRGQTAKQTGCKPRGRGKGKAVDKPARGKAKPGPAPKPAAKPGPPDWSTVRKVERTDFKLEEKSSFWKDLRGAFRGMFGAKRVANAAAKGKSGGKGKGAGACKRGQTARQTGCTPRGGKARGPASPVPPKKPGDFGTGVSKTGAKTDHGEGLVAGRIRLAEKRAATARRQGNKKLAELYEEEARKLKKNPRAGLTRNGPGGRKGKPSARLAMTPGKACKIVKDGTAHGKPLTPAQRGMFGAKCGQRTDNKWSPAARKAALEARRRKMKKRGDISGRDMTHEAQKRSFHAKSTAEHRGASGAHAVAAVHHRKAAERCKAKLGTKHKKCRSLDDRAKAHSVAARRHGEKGGIAPIARRVANTDQARSQVTGQFKYPGGATGKGPEHTAAQHGAFRPSAEDLARGGQLHAAWGDSRDHRRMPTWAGNRTKWVAATRKAHEGGYTGREYWDAAAHIYRRTGGAIRPDGSTGGQPAVTNQEGRMATRKQKLVKWLTTNCDCFAKAGRQLDALDEETLEALRQKEMAGQRDAVVANAAREGVAVPGTGYFQVWNEEAEAYELQDEDGNVVESVELNDDESEEEDEEETPANVVIKPKPGKAKGKAKLALEDLPEELQEEIQVVRNLGRQVRKQLIGRLVANHASKDPKKRKALAAELEKRPTKDLQLMASFLPGDDRAVANKGRGKGKEDDDGNEDDNPIVNFFGAGVGATNNRRRAADDGFDENDVMELPTLNFGNRDKDDYTPPARGKKVKRSEADVS